MKTTRFVTLTLVSLSFLSLSALAGTKEKNNRKHVTIQEDSSIEYSQSSQESTYTAQRAGRIGVGFSTISSTIPGSTAAITGIFDLTHYDAIQAFFSIPATSPFNIGAAALYKRTIAESKGAGFHVGGGLGFANVNTGGLGGGPNFAMNLSAIGGFHFELPGISHINVHLDGGPTFVLVSTSPSASTNFQVGALSPALGASVVYIF